MQDAREKDAVLLKHIRECLDRIQEYTGDDPERFRKSQLVQDAVVRNLQIMAESSQRLSDTIKATEPGIPWQDIAGFRNVLTHGYLALDTAVVWSVVEGDLPVLREAVARMARRNDRDAAE
jgi:uncharacterized protein with HEPN domain